VNRGIWVYDIETFGNFFSCIFYNVDTKERKDFIVCEHIDQLRDFCKFVLSDEMKGMIGFNNVGFDYPVIHRILKNRNKLFSFSGLKKALEIKKYANEVISSEFSKIFNPFVPQLDLYLINHMNNKARACGLKWCEFALRWANIQDLPFSHDHMVKESEIEDVMSYNFNDVIATYELYRNCDEKIELRKKLSKTYKLKLLNANDPKIGSEIFAKFICESKGITWKQLKNQRTYRESINLKECIFPYVKFESQKFNDLLNHLKDQVITSTKGVFKNLSVIHKGISYDYGVGGLHASLDPGVYEADDDYEIWDWDVKMAASRNLVNSGKPKLKNMAILSEVLN